MLRKTPFKVKVSNLKKSPLKIKNYNGLKKTPIKQTANKLAVNTPMKKQSDSAKERWEEARKKCIARDKVCRICGRPITQVHHIHLRSKRKDLLYHLNNLIGLCDKHHFHKGSEKYFEQCKIIADSKNMTVEELLTFAEN